MNYRLRRTIKSIQQEIYYVVEVIKIKFSVKLVLKTQLILFKKVRTFPVEEENNFQNRCDVLIAVAKYSSIKFRGDTTTVWSFLSYYVDADSFLLLYYQKQPPEVFYNKRCS